MKKVILGLFALTMTLSTIAQSPDQQKGRRQEHRQGAKHQGDSYLEKLNLLDAQKTQIKSVNDNFRQQMQDLKNQGSLTADQQKEQRKELSRKHREQIQAILTPEQRKQAETLKQEFRGKKGDSSATEKTQHKDGKRDGNNRGGRFGDLTKELNLSPEQSARIASINESFKSNLQSLKQNTSVSKEDKREQMKSLAQKHKSSVEAILTADQKNELKNRLKNRPNRTAVK